MPDRAALELPRPERGQRTLGDHLGSDELGEASDLRAGGLVGPPVLIGENRQFDLLATPEVSRVARGQLSDKHEVGPRGLELIPSAVQLDRVRLTVDSAVVAEPDERGRALAPEIAEADVTAVLIRENGVGEALDGGHAMNRTY